MRTRALMAPAIWLLVSVLAAAPSVAAAPPDAAEGDLSVYEVHPLVDGAVVGLGAASVGLANGFSSSLVHPRCPCDPAEVNAFDRTVIGNHNVIADRASDGTVVLTWIAPVLVDALDVGADRVLWPWVVTAAAGVMVGTERVLAGRHFYSDVAAGALSGIIVGWAVPEFHRRAKISLSVVPLRAGAALSLLRTF